MVLSVGLVSACIIYKKRPGALTRLQKLQKVLKLKPISQKTLYCYPVKKIFSIFLIMCFMAGLSIFLGSYRAQVSHNHLNQSDHHLNQQQQPQQAHYLFPHKPQQTPFSLDSPIDHSNPTTQFQSLSNFHQYQRVQKTVNWIIVFFLFPLVALIGSLQFQRIVIRGKQLRQPIQVSGRILKQRLGMLSGWKLVKQYVCWETDLIFIELCGENRFSHTDYYYSIKKVSTKDKGEEASSSHHKQDQNSSSPSLDSASAVSPLQQQIVRKGSIYQTRQAVIYMCHILKKQVNLNIKNGPVKQTKKKKAKMTKMTKNKFDPQSQSK